MIVTPRCSAVQVSLSCGILCLSVRKRFNPDKCIIFGALLAVFAIIWDALISYRKVKAIKVKFLWGILSIQGIGITLLLLVKTSTTSIVLLLLAIQIISLVATLIIGRKTD